MSLCCLKTLKFKDFFYCSLCSPYSLIEKLVPCRSCISNLKPVALGQQSLVSSKETVVRGQGDGDPRQGVELSSVVTLEGISHP